MANYLKEINAHSPNAQLIDSIKKQLGKKVTFSNGCQVDLVTDDGVVWGQCPYGNTWACIANEGFADKIANWVEYWNTPRDEGGVEIATTVCS